MAQRNDAMTDGRLTDTGRGTVVLSQRAGQASRAAEPHTSNI
eukprot:COSAG01_NODE_300_length_19226_cov_41.536519_26_plen_42_part_00